MNDTAPIPSWAHPDAAGRSSEVRPQRPPPSDLRPPPSAPWRFALRRLARHKGPFALALFWSVVFILVPMQVPVITGALVDSLRAKHARLYGLGLDPSNRLRSVK